jgi:protein TonB
MKSALIISLAAHVAVGFIWFRLVKISQVRFVPRQVYTVSLVTPSESPKLTTEKDTPPPEPTPKPEQKEEEQEEMAPPPEKPKPKDKPKPVKKAIPSSDIKKTEVEPEETNEEAGEQAETGDIMLDGQDFPFAYYLATMKRKIAAQWQVPGSSSTEPKQCQVYFRVGRDGAIQSPTIATSSGTFLFDQAALRAVVQAGPLPALPSGFTDDYLGVHFWFAYEKE